MPTNMPSESELRRIKASLETDLAIHQSAQEGQANSKIRRTNDVLIAEVTIALAWVNHLLGEPRTISIEQAYLLPRV